MLHIDEELPSRDLSNEDLLMVLSDSSFQEHHRPRMHLQKLLAIKLGNMPSNNFALTGAMQAT